jgi:large subunit ribosomal protein L25
MQRLELEVNVREGRGKGAVRKLRRGGRVPAVVYGFGMEPLDLEVETRRLERAVGAGSSALFSLTGPKALQGKVVLVKDVQKDALTGGLLHADFYSVDLTKRLKVDVAIHLDGKAPGIELGGVLESLLREVEVLCLPLAIPERFVVDVSALSIGDAIHLRDLQAPEGVEIQGDPTQVVVHVVIPRVEVVEAPPAVEGAVPVEGEAPAAEAPAETPED